MTDVLIVGAGPAGLTAAIYAMRAGLSAMAFDKNMYGGQMVLTSEIQNYPSIMQAEGVELASNMYNHATRLGAQIRFEEVTGVELTGKVKRVHTMEGVYEGRSIILAGGATRRKLGCPGEQEYIGRGVSYCATCDAAFYKDKTVAIVGGGSTALEDALFLSNHCKKVYLIHRRDEFRGEKVLQKAIAERENIEVVFFATVHEITGGEKVEQLLLNTKEGPRTLKVDGVFVAIGLVPESTLYGELLPVDEAGYVAAGENCATPIEGVYVAGDLRAKPLRQIITACADGAVAAVGAAAFCNAALPNTCSVQTEPFPEGEGYS